MAKKPPAPTDIRTRLHISELSSAQGITPLDYAIPDQTEWRAQLLTRLAGLITAGATDIETVEVLDDELVAQRELEHSILNDQRVSHRIACADIVTVATRDLKHARRQRKLRKKQFVVAKTELDALRALRERGDTLLLQNA